MGGEACGLPAWPPWACSAFRERLLALIASALLGAPPGGLPHSWPIINTHAALRSLGAWPPRGCGVALGRAALPSCPCLSAGGRPGVPTGPGRGGTGVGAVAPALDPVHHVLGGGHGTAGRGSLGGRTMPRSARTAGCCSASPGCARAAWACRTPVPGRNTSLCALRMTNLLCATKILGGLVGGHGGEEGAPRRGQAWGQAGLALLQVEEQAKPGPKAPGHLAVPAPQPEPASSWPGRALMGRDTSCSSRSNCFSWERTAG